MVKCGFFFCDSHEFWHFWHHNFWLYIHEFFKNQLDIYFLVSWDIFGFIITVFYSNGLLLSQGLYVVFQPTVPRWFHSFQRGSFCKFLGDAIFPSTFLNKTDFKVIKELQWPGKMWLHNYRHTTTTAQLPPHYYQAFLW